MIIHGRNLIVKVGGVAVAGARSCDVNVECDEQEVSSATSSKWREFIAGRNSWTVQCSGLVVLDENDPLTENAAMVGTKVALSIEVEDTTDVLTGYAIVKAWRVTGTLGNLAQQSTQFRGTGALG